MRQRTGPRGAAARVLTKLLKLRRNIASKAGGADCALPGCLGRCRPQNTLQRGPVAPSAREEGYPATSPLLPPPPPPPSLALRAPPPPPPGARAPAHPTRPRPAALAARARQSWGLWPCSSPLSGSPPPLRSLSSPLRRRTPSAREGRRRSPRLLLR